MSLLQKIIDQVSIEVRQKGVKCRGKGGVRIDEHNLTRIVSFVVCDNDPPRNVTLLREDHTLEYLCSGKSCQEAAVPCEHVWATLLYAEALGYLNDWEGHGRVQMRQMGVKQDDDTGKGSHFSRSSDAIKVMMGSQAQSASASQGSDDWKRGFSTLRERFAPSPSA